MSLSSLGISTDEERVYRFLLQHPGSPADLVASALDLRPESVRSSLESLRSVEFVRLDAQRVVWPADPGIAVERLIQRRQDEISQSLHHITAAKNAIPGLVGHQRAAAPHGPEELIEGVEEVNAHIEDLLFYAREVLSPVHSAGVGSGSVE